MWCNLNSAELKEIYNKGVINVGNLSRMKRVMEKAMAGTPITAAFIGGSITAGAAATAEEKSYVYLVYNWWRNRFPNSRVKYINAGVGATTSQFGAARVEQDVLCLEPDVVFAEFSVNDEDNEFYEETFEGLIRKNLLHKSEPALFMFNNVFYDDGRNAQRVHNRIGIYYDLPIVSIRESIYRMIEQGRISNTLISADNLHPNDLGHRLVAEVINNLLDRIYDLVIHGEPCENFSVPAETVTKNRYYSSAIRNNKNTYPKLNGFYRDETEKNGVWDVFRYGWYAIDSGSSIRFEVEGAIISVQYRKYALHPAPMAKLFIDGNTEQAFILDANFDETWGDKLYLQDIMIEAVPGRHTVEIILTEAVPDREFYLASVITA